MSRYLENSENEFSKLAGPLGRFINTVFDNLDPHEISDLRKNIATSIREARRDARMSGIGQDISVINSDQKLKLLGIGKRGEPNRVRFQDRYNATDIAGPYYSMPSKETGFNSAFDEIIAGHKQDIEAKANERVFPRRNYDKAKDLAHEMKEHNKGTYSSPNPESPSAAAAPSFFDKMKKNWPWLAGGAAGVGAVGGGAYYLRSKMREGGETAKKEVGLSKAAAIIDSLAGGVPLLSSADGRVIVSAGLPYGIGVDLVTHPEEGVSPMVGMGLLGPHIGARFGKKDVVSNVRNLVTKRKES